MKITELLNTPEKSQGTTSCGTTSSAIKGQPAQDIVSQIDKYNFNMSLVSFEKIPNEYIAKYNENISIILE